MAKKKTDRMKVLTSHNSPIPGKSDSNKLSQILEKQPATFLNMHIAPTRKVGNTTYVLAKKKKK